MHSSENPGKAKASNMITQLQHPVETCYLRHFSSCSMCNENTSSFTEEQEPGCQNPTVGYQQSDSIDQTLCKLVLFVSTYCPPNLHVPIVLSLFWYYAR